MYRFLYCYYFYLQTYDIFVKTPNVFSFILTYAQYYPPPNTSVTFIFLYINQLYEFLSKRIFSANVQKKQQFDRSLGNAQRPPEVKRVLPLGPGGLIAFFN